MAKFNVLTATVSDLEKSFKEGLLTSEFVVTEYLKQIEVCNGYLHAVIETAPRELVLEKARLLDNERSRARAQGQVLGPLHGIPLLLKDNIATHPELGMDTTAGTYALKGAKVRDSAPCVKQLEKAGAIILAKANLGEMSNFRGLHMPAGWSAVGGLTQSPYVIGGKKWDDGFCGHSSTAGSSSGSCSGVAAGFAPAALGTDTNGSILVPATRHDVYAMKPTFGLVSNDGIVPISLDFDSAGPIARCARDIALLMDAMIDRQKASEIQGGTYTSYLTKSFEGIRVGVLQPKDWHMEPHVLTPNAEADTQQDEEIAQAYEKLRSLGVGVKEISIASLDGLIVDNMSQIQRVMDSQFRRTIGSYLQSLESSKVRSLAELMQFMRDNSKLELPDESPNMTRLEGAAGFQLSEEDYQKALADMRDFGRRRGVDKSLGENEVDIILGPADSRIHEYYSTSGYPMIHLPLSYMNFNGRPFGLCAIAKANQEGLLIKFMSAWEANFNTERQLPTWLNGDPSKWSGEASKDDL
ncbi:putative glutamyl-tRNA amidotransferase subunit A [Nemania abortiva]|nr:putative glutamyl-tRNA amidotransferase subunit A [Nemania abortiva]